MRRFLLLLGFVSWSQLLFGQSSNLRLFWLNYNTPVEKQMQQWEIGHPSLLEKEGAFLIDSLRGLELRNYAVQYFSSLATYLKDHSSTAFGYERISYRIYVEKDNGVSCFMFRTENMNGKNVSRRDPSYMKWMKEFFSEHPFNPGVSGPFCYSGVLLNGGMKSTK
jgi:hypothetical protein